MLYVIICYQVALTDDS